ncbi:hypothetical protein E4T65_30505, partial [Pseudomonas fluorescens]
MGTLHEGLLYDGENMEIRTRWIALSIWVIKEQKVTNNLVGASLLAMVVNDNAGNLTPRGVLRSIVGTPPGAGSLLQGGNQLRA